MRCYRKKVDSMKWHEELWRVEVTLHACKVQTICVIRLKYEELKSEVKFYFLSAVHTWVARILCMLCLRILSARNTLAFKKNLLACFGKSPSMFWEISKHVFGGCMLRARLAIAACSSCDCCVFDLRLLRARLAIAVYVLPAFAACSCWLRSVFYKR